MDPGLRQVSLIEDPNANSQSIVLFGEDLKINVENTVESSIEFVDSVDGGMMRDAISAIEQDERQIVFTDKHIYQQGL